jgi:hypothetical protein
MDVIITCEESQAVTKAFRRSGVQAFSCDLLDCSGGHPEWHIKGDAIAAIRSREWYKVISFPPCTDLSCSGSGHYAKKRLSGEQEQSINFFIDIWLLSDAVENPKNIMSGWQKKGSYLNRWYPHIVDRMYAIGFPKTYTQKFQPWEFGHGETKETWLWLKGLPKLISTNIVEGRENRIWRMPPSEDRGKLRSKTYEGVAAAMASQWTKVV